jgi:hypothetical protein
MPCRISGNGGGCTPFPTSTWRQYPGYGFGMSNFLQIFAIATSEIPRSLASKVAGFNQTF